MSVTESTTGTMPESEGQVKTSPSENGKTPEIASKVSSEDAPKLYSQVEADALVHTAKSEAGRDAKTVEVERDTLKAQITTKESELEDIVAERESLNKQIDDLASHDPDRFNLVKKGRELRERERKVEAERQALEADKQVHSDRLTRLEKVERDISILEIIDDYENAAPEKLTDLAETFGVKTKEQLIKIANSLWTKKAEKPAPPSMTVDSGVTSGGASDFSALSPREKIEKGIEQWRKKK